ncbi:hypothetical protein cypCar_00041804, partial [Cyprinus carpio]
RPWAARAGLAGRSGAARNASRTGSGPAPASPPGYEGTVRTACLPPPRPHMIAASRCTLSWKTPALIAILVLATQGADFASCACRPGTGGHPRAVATGLAPYLCRGAGPGGHLVTWRWAAPNLVTVALGLGGPAVPCAGWRPTHRCWAWDRVILWQWLWAGGHRCAVVLGWRPLLCGGAGDLRLRDCGVTDEGCAALASALRSNPSHLRELDLSENELGDSGVKLLSDLKDDPHSKLQTLYYRQCQLQSVLVSSEEYGSTYQQHHQSPRAVALHPPQPSSESVRTSAVGPQCLVNSVAACDVMSQLVNVALRPLRWHHYKSCKGQTGHIPVGSAGPWASSIK